MRTETHDMPESRADAGCGCAPAAQAPPCCGSGRPTRADVPFADSFVDEWLDTPAGRVAHVTTRLDWRDTAGRWARRWGIGRAGYRVAPGLYAVGEPGAASPVLLTANYKMTFDALRKELGGQDAWVLVLDTFGINVWCAAGKGTFGTEEVVRRVKAAGLERLVSHRTLVLPQLGAPGVGAHEVRNGCGFKVVYGPVYARDIKRFLADGMKATPGMRRVEFPVTERLALAPVEVVGSLRPARWLAPALFLLAGIGPGIFSPAAAWHRGLAAVCVLAAGIVAGAVVTPVLLPWLPGKTFSGKGALVGAVAAAAALAWGESPPASLHGLALLLALPAISSFVAMNFTGSTPFTSPSGVEKEMRRAMPVQALAAALAAAFWIGGAFVRLARP
ncbi:MAG TPA: mercury methylation corrinoid protein HgcA [Candidatus Deferrimicrobiaceae bacterium]